MLFYSHSDLIQIRAQNFEIKCRSELGFFTRFSTANLDVDCWLVLDIHYHSYDYARRITVSDQETRSVSALGSRVDNTSSEVKLCDRVSDQIGIAYGWYVYIVQIGMKLILKFVDKKFEMVFEVKIYFVKYMGK